LQSIERLPLTAQHSLHLVRVAGRVILIAVSPGGCSVLDGGGFEAIENEGRLIR
jgi:flagellar biogenesis protein FliO